MYIKLVDNFFTTNRKRQAIVPHLGLLSLEKYLSLNLQDCNIKIIDPKIEYIKYKGSAFNEFLIHITEVLSQDKPDIIGFTSIGVSFPFVLAAAKIIKAKNPNIKIFLGGPHTSILTDKILKTYDFFDICFIKESEQSFLEVVKLFNQTKQLLPTDLQKIPNISFKYSGKVFETHKSPSNVDLSVLYNLNYSHYFNEVISINSINLEVGRGCPFPCTFCSTATYFQRKHRLKPLKTIATDIKNYHSKYGVNHFDLNHDIFTLKKEQIYNFCKEVYDLNITWECSTRPDCINEDLIKTMKDSGCKSIYFGIETGSQRLQKVIKKNLNIDKSIKNVLKVASKKINATVSFITGFPNESLEDQNETLSTILSLTSSQPNRIFPQLHILSPEPGTEIYNNKFELKIDNYSTYDSNEIVTHDEISENKEIFSVFYYYESNLPRIRTIIANQLISKWYYILGGPLFNKIFSIEKLIDFIDTTSDELKDVNNISTDLVDQTLMKSLYQFPKDLILKESVHYIFNTNMLKNSSELISDNKEFKLSGSLFNFDVINFLKDLTNDFYNVSEYENYKSYNLICYYEEKLNNSIKSSSITLYSKFRTAREAFLNVIHKTEQYQAPSME